MSVCLLAFLYDSLSYGKLQMMLNFLQLDRHPTGSSKMNFMESKDFKWTTRLQ